MFVSTKIQIPHVRHTLVSRPRLMSKLDEGMHAKLIHVSAQAGYGKTTVLSEWAKQCRAQVAWVSLDKHDNDWVQFWGCIIASIRDNVPGFGLETLPLFEKGLSVSPSHAIHALLNELSRLNDELVIIIDDYHFIELADIHESLRDMIEHLPSSVHVYMISRADLAIPTARLLAKGEFHQVNTQDLRFQLDEGIVFFRDTADLSLTYQQVTELYEQTEGWISGLQLAAISLKHSENIEESIHQFGGRHRHISDYLLEEVLHHQSESLRAFLLETSILNRMNHSLCQAVTGQTDSQKQLETLEQLNLFIIPLDGQRNWYRYHHLLSDFLQQLLYRTDLDRWTQAHIHAAQWLEKHGFDEEAVEHYLEGKQYADAMRLIEKNLEPLMQKKSVALMKWVSALPADSFREKPVIEMFYISVLLGVGEWKAALERIGQARVRYEALQHQSADAQWNQMMGNIYFFSAIASYLQKDLDQTSEYFDLVEQHVPEGSLFQTMGRNRYQGFDSFDDHLAFINDLHAADEFLQEWIGKWEQKQDYPFVGYLFAAYSKLLYEWNRLEDAEIYCTQALGRKDVQPFARIIIQIAISASRIQQAKGDSHRAFELLEQLKSQIDSPDHDLFTLRIEAEQAELSLRQGSLEYAWDWLQRCETSHTDDVSLSRVAEHLVLARVLMACGRVEDSLFLLERMDLLLTKEDRLRDRIKVLILQSMAYYHQGQNETALIPLETALQLGEPQGYIRSFIDEGDEMADMLSAYVKLRKGVRAETKRLVSLDYVKGLLQALDGAEKESFKELLTNQEKRVLRLIVEGLSNKEIGHRLNISSETVKSHIKNVYKKLQVDNRLRAMQRAMELELLA